MTVAKDEVNSNEVNSIIYYNMGLSRDGVSIYNLTKTKLLPYFTSTLEIFRNGESYSNHIFVGGVSEYTVTKIFEVGTYTAKDTTDYQVNNVSFEVIKAKKLK
ncbi:hypothetical protein ALNOE001_12380 [Candidatus Methanobinarius endosymbioticus]|uniref:Uncharacterized protein n=1 Tax=Candidatus Methanobinarius endosymbioticus TaxID=2006182 RepID=A0A366M9U1_9EURY|nr:hypothetical protein ALNOE001_12380 [Candidatus Methanobinarius endosymbioticus]